MIGVTLFAIYLAGQRAFDEFRFHKGDGPNAAKLAASLEAVNEIDPEFDAEEDFRNGDLSYVAISGKYGLELPGLPESEWDRITKSQLFRKIQGTTGEFESRNHNWLNSRARHYATHFNSHLGKLQKDNLGENAR